ncbi:hypothetical protein D7V93_36410 [Corallococcus llansteffanensis]|uniref:Uncharacterized protein n=1 Tax=Corallococcus llansteffanensis TaxID=2316731 RepID=A0A3A8NKZ1_9BACT|nr:hypothetical protein D7V93_36410 [Corallococcus llansteffanensis]
MGRTVIGRLRLRGTDLDPLSAKLRLESLLSGAHLSPVGLPPSATVCIRRLVDPKPGVLPVRQFAPSPPPAWDEAFSAALSAQLARAARPAQGPVPPSAEAVLFLDPSELLACLASDVWRGTAAVHWWWKGLFPSADLALRVVAEWLRRPEYVPAALEAVARRSEARPVLSLFSGDEARTLLARVCVTQGLPALASALGAFEEEAARDEVMPKSRPRVAKEERVSGSGAVPLTPWEAWVPEARAPGLGREHQTLLGVALMLRRAPLEARHAAFIPAVVAWRREEARVTTGDGTREPVRSVGVTPESRPESGAEEVQALAPRVPGARAVQPIAPEQVELGPLPSAARSTEAPRLEPASRREPTDTSTPALTSPFAVPPLAASIEAPVWPIHVEASATPSVVMLAPEPTSAPQAPPPLPGLLPSSETRFISAPGRGWGLPISTGLGGLFYLVNVGLFLEFYGDFTQPAFPCLPLPLWDFVALLGQRLLGDARPSDAVWKVLALLSGRRPGEAPGHAFEPPEDWRVPESWLRAFRTQGAAAWTWSLTDRRLRVRHPAGFLVLDILAPEPSDSAEALVRRELALFSTGHTFTLEPGDVPAPTGPGATPLERWLGWLVPYVRARLSRALGVPPDDTEALERMLLMHDARLHLTETHVDVVLALAQLPLEVRVAGLDRDIGWIPSAGRHLTFHFE